MLVGQKPGASTDENETDANSNGFENESESGTQNEGDGSDNLSHLSEKDRAYIASLRAENAKYRTKAKNLEGDLTGVRGEVEKLKKGFKSALGIEDEAEEIDPEAVQGALGHYELQNAMLVSAMQNGIGMDGLEYYQFLLNKQLEQLEDGEEISDEDYATIVQKVKQTTGGGTMTKTSVSNAEGGKTPGESGEISLDAFSKMGMIEKSQLYAKNPELYNRLQVEAQKTKRFI